MMIQIKTVTLRDGSQIEAIRDVDKVRELVRENAKLRAELDASCNAEELRQVRAENAKLREACYMFLEARKHGDYGMEDAERAIRAAIN